MLCLCFLTARPCHRDPILTSALFKIFEKKICTNGGSDRKQMEESDTRAVGSASEQKPGEYSYIHPPDADQARPKVYRP